MRLDECACLHVCLRDRNEVEIVERRSCQIHIGVCILSTIRRVVFSCIDATAFFVPNHSYVYLSCVIWVVNGERIILNRRRDECQFDI